MDAYLYHHGVKGQRWGVRRYQNADGSLTPSGKLHYKSIGEAMRTQADARRAANEASWNTLKARGKQIKTFSKAVTTSFGKDGSEHSKALKEYRRATTKAHKEYAKAVDAQANYAASRALTKRGAIRARQNTYRGYLALNSTNFTSNGKKQYAEIVRKSQTVNGKSITDELTKRGKMDAFVSMVIP